MREPGIEEIVKKFVINDYFTPNIKAEVILDTLLTPCIGGIIKKQTGLDVAFVTKEMSILVQEGKGLYGKKIDYICADKKYVYLVELKTSKSSMDDRQVEFYVETCMNRRFSDVLGRQLLNILATKFRIASFNDNQSTPKSILISILEKYREPIRNTRQTFSDAVISIMRKHGFSQTRKYLYTLSQIVDFTEHNIPIWDKELKLIYLTPASIPYVKKAMLKDECDFFIKNRAGGTISFCDGLKDMNSNDSYVRMMQNIIQDIF